MDLLELLMKKQAELGLSGRAFARLLGIDDSLWVAVRKGRSPIRWEILKGAFRAFPADLELREAAIAYIEADGLAEHRAAGFKVVGVEDASAILTEKAS